MRLRGSSLSRRYSRESICDLSVSIPVLGGKERRGSGMCGMLGGECRELAGMSQSFSASRMCPKRVSSSIVFATALRAAGTGIRKSPLLSFPLFITPGAGGVMKRRWRMRGIKGTMRWLDTAFPFTGKVFRTASAVTGKTVMRIWSFWKLHAHSAEGESGVKPPHSKASRHAYAGFAFFRPFFIHTLAPVE